MEFPGDLKYSGSDEWIKADGNTATLGVTDFAQDQLSDIVYFEIVVGVGDVISKGDEVATLESVKAAAEINSPVSGEVTEINAALPDSPEVVNSDPYSGGWMLRIRMSDPTELEQLMDSGAYQENTEERSS